MKSFVFILFIILSPILKAESVKDIFSPFQEILSKHLIESKLDNGGYVSAFRYLEASEDTEVKRLRKQQKNKLKNFSIKSLDNKNKANAFWINAYNFFMIDYILTHRDDGNIVTSVKDYGSFFNPYKVFSKEFINISDSTYTLDKIEKGILLGDEFKEKNWFDAKVHFAVNCASVGCPPLRQEVYHEDNIEEMLVKNTQMALRTPRHLTLKGETLRVTHLFKWYKDDFAKESGSALKFIKKYTPKDVSKKIGPETSMDYIEYDWSLNKPSNFNDI